MRGKLFFSAATAALMLLVPAAAAQQTDPAGDASTTARLDGSIESELSPAGDKDWYRLSVQEGRRYSVTLEGIPDDAGAAVDPTLAIYDAQGTQLAFNDDANDLNSALQYAPSQSGDVFVEAGSFLDQGMGRYRLNVTSGEVPPDDAGNDANTRARAQPGRSINGNIEYEGDVDWYRLQARVGQRYHITLNSAEGEGALNDPLLRVVDGEGNEHALSDDSEGSLNSALDFTPTANGDFYLEASAYAGAYTGRYTLNVTAERAPTDNTSADTRTRGRLRIGDSTNADLSFAGDVDWYRVRLEEGNSYRFTLNSNGESSLGDPLLRLYDSSGTEVGMDDDGGDGLNSYLEYTAPRTGNYFVSAGAFAEGSTGGYTLAARTGDIPGDNTTDASLSADGDYREGVLSPAGDKDWFRVEMTEGQGMRVGLTSTQTPDALSDPYLVLYGPDGAEILRDDDGGDGLNSWFEYSATTAGSYYIEVRGFSEDAAGRYAISITGGEISGSPDMAENITANGDGRISTISPADDSDWFAIEMIEGRPYRFFLNGVDPDPLADPLLTLFDAQGNQVAVDDDGGAGVNSYLTFTSPTGGPYFAAVSSFNGGSAGRYELRVVDTDVPGHAYTDENLDPAGDDRISNIDIPGDIDAWRVELEAGVRYVIEVNGTGETPLRDAFLTIVDAEDNRVASDDDSGNGMDARLRFTPETGGTYYIQASGLGGSTGWYQVSILRQ